jgi:hypothetical protein
MSRKTLAEQLRESNAQLSLAQIAIKEQGQKIMMLERERMFHLITERRFETLLEGMCMAMREGNLPRRSNG